MMGKYSEVVEREVDERRVVGHGHNHGDLVATVAFMGYFALSPSLSLSIYIYIYVCVCVCVCAWVSFTILHLYVSSC